MRTLHSFLPSRRPALAALAVAVAAGLSAAFSVPTDPPVFTNPLDFTNEWQPFVRVQSRRNNELTCIYSSTSGQQWKLLIATMERREATIIRVKLNPNGMMRWIERPPHSARTWRD